MLLHRRATEQHMARFYRLRVQPRLWGGVSVVREWRRIGSPGRLRAAERLAVGKRRRGYE